MSGSKSIKTFRRQRGVALITVLLVMVIAIALVSHAITRDQISITRSGALLANTQLAEFVAGAEAWSRVALLKDFEEDKDAAEPADHALEAWASPALQFNPDNGKIRINIKDLNSCFNVNNLVSSSNGNDQFEIFRRLVSNVTGKSDLAGIIADWMDDNDTPRSSATEDDGYLGRDLAHRTPDTLISDISELSSVQEMELEDWQKLAPFLCALPETETKININLASQELIEAVDSSASVSKLLQFRESGGILSQSGDLSSYNITKTNQFMFHSQHFLARIAVQLGDSEDYRQYWETALWLDEAGDGEVKVVQRQRRTFSGAMMQELLDYDGTAASEDSR
ncbi:type II secretion system minor pseudopilin GspK [Microbulbifer sp. THAF38]|uniref:type II secretion system minor pseudopilin GspK n=1 Tax=unclassified Microbulbifer TaxID=2619833 RepID=UPI0012687467|nr:type II secretion system minor pseudopilin GspK [Microbulbifer sp. THAF38]QFT54966.1 Putative type II secretion system protein K [Microbulbifer sp. THAF38]